MFTGQYIDEKSWDERNKKVRKSHPNSLELNNLILVKLAEANKKILEAEYSNDDISVGKIKRNVKGINKLDFFALAEMYLENIKNAEKFRQYETQRGRIVKFKKFVGQDHLPFREITVFLLKNFEGYILNQEKRKPRTAVNYMILIRRLYNLAISESIVDSKSYPFGKGKIQIRIPESEKIGLNVMEVKLLENAKDLTAPQIQAVDVWLTSFYFAGIRVGDVIQLKWSDFNDGRLLYRMNKNQKLVSLKVPVKARVILNKYKKNSKKESDFVFPFLKTTNMDDAKEVLTRTRTVTRSLNRILKRVTAKIGIDKNLTMHIARHTFGNISGDKIPIQMLQKLYRHSSITTTVTYQANFMNDDTDDALDRVIGF